MKPLSCVALAVSALVLAAATAAASVVNTRPVAFNGSALQTYLDGKGQVINVNADQIGIPGKILITADGQVGWLSP